MSDNAVDYKYYANDTGTTRAYLLNTWNASGRKVTDISAETAVAQSVEVTFSVANVYAALPYGDLNEDGAVDTIDLLDLSLEVAQKGAGLPATFDDRKVKLADLDDSGDLDSTDIYYLLLHIAQSGAGITVDPFPVTVK